MTPTREEYVAAKQHQADNPDLYASQDPIPLVLANVQIINAYEAAAWLDHETNHPDVCPCVWFSATVPDPGACACTHSDTAHVDSICTAPVNQQP